MRECKTLLLLDTELGSSAQLYPDLQLCTFNVLETLRNDDKLLLQLDLHRPDCLVVNTATLKPSLIHLFKSIHDICPLAVVVFVTEDTPELIESMVRAGVSAYVVDDRRQHRLYSLISEAVTRFQAQEALRHELVQTKNKLAERKIIDQAKGLLMQTQGLSEQDAYATLRKMAMNQGKSLVVIAHRVIELVSESYPKAR